MIRECNESVSKKFSNGIKEVREITSIQVPDKFLESRSIHLVCEDRRLSMMRMGLPFQVVDLTKSEVDDIEPEWFEFLIEVSAGMLDVENAPASGKNTKRMKWEITESDGFKLCRKKLKSNL